MVFLELVQLAAEDELRALVCFNFNHLQSSIDHAECYANGQVHTNSLENFWSLLKRTIAGTYVSVEPFHLFRYLDEQAHRFNTRKLSDAARFAVTRGHVMNRGQFVAQRGSMTGGWTGSFDKLEALLEQA